MAITQNTYTGNGSTVLYSFTFPYLETTDVKVTVHGVITTAYTFANATQIQFNTAPLANTAIRIYRDTDDASLAATFYPGSAIRSQDLNDNFTQNLYVTQEVNNNAVDIDGSNPMAGNLNMGGFKVTNLATPVAGTDAANRSFVEGVFSSEVPVFYRRWSKTAAGGETSLSGNDSSGSALSYVPGSEKVFINGALQVRGVDYSGTTGTTLTVTPALIAGDIVEVHSSSSYTVGTIPDQSVTNAKVEAGAGIAASKLSFTQTGTGAVARTVDSKLKDVVSVKDFGAVGDGVVNDTVAVQAAVNHACGIGKSVYFPAGTYSVSTLLITNGIAGIYCEGTIKGQGVAPLATVVLGAAGFPVNNATFTLRMDQSSGDPVAVQGYDTNGCNFTSCVIRGFTNHPTLNHFGFKFDGPSKNNRFIGNHIEMFSSPTPNTGWGIAFYGTSGTALDYGGFFAGTLSRAQFPATGNVVSGNVITNGSYAISLQWSEHNTVANNCCFNQQFRSIFLAAAAMSNTVTGNVIKGYGSSAVIIAYNSGKNVVSTNYCETSVEGGEAAINLNTGAQGNLIAGNNIDSRTNYGIYLGCDMVANTIVDNTVSSYGRAGILLENDWENPLPPGAITSRPNYGAPPSPYTKWSSVDSKGNVIKGNVLAAGGSHGSSPAAISLAQITTSSNTKLLDNAISENHVTSDDNIFYNLFLYAETPANFTGTVITGNIFHPGNTEISQTTTGPTTWNERIRYFADNLQLDQKLIGEPVLFADGDATPSISSNSSLPNERVFSFANYITPTNVTYFDDGYDGCIITVRLNSNVTLKNNSSLIRLKGSVDAAANSNNFIQLTRISSIWFETWRSF